MLRASLGKQLKAPFLFFFFFSAGRLCLYYLKDMWRRSLVAS